MDVCVDCGRFLLLKGDTAERQYVSRRQQESHWLIEGVEYCACGHKEKKIAKKLAAKVKKLEKQLLKVKDDFLEASFYKDTITEEAKQLEKDMRTMRKGWSLTKSELAWTKHCLASTQRELYFTSQECKELREELNARFMPPGLHN